MLIISEQSPQALKIKKEIEQLALSNADSVLIVLITELTSMSEEVKTQINKEIFLIEKEGINYPNIGVLILMDDTLKAEGFKYPKNETAILLEEISNPHRTWFSNFLINPHERIAEAAARAGVQK